MTTRESPAHVPPPLGVSWFAGGFSVLQDFRNDSNKAGGKVDLQLSPAVSAFGRYGWRGLATNARHRRHR